MADKDDDVASHNRRAMEKSIDYGEKSFGKLNPNPRKGGSNITSTPQVRGEPTVSPFIQVYPAPRRHTDDFPGVYNKGGKVKANPFAKGGSPNSGTNYCKGGKVRT